MEQPIAQEVLDGFTGVTPDKVEKMKRQERLHNEYLATLKEKEE